MLDLDERLAGLVDDLERPVLLVALDLGVARLAPDEPLGVEDRVLRVGVVRVLRRVADEPLVVRERDPGRRDAVALVVRDYTAESGVQGTGQTTQDKRRPAPWLFKAMTRSSRGRTGDGHVRVQKRDGWLLPEPFLPRTPPRT